MVKAGNLPIFGQRLLSERLAGRNPEDMVVVSLIGHIPEEFSNNTKLLADPRQKYDWRILAGLNVCLLINENVLHAVQLMTDVRKAMPVGDLYVWDVDKSVGAELAYWPHPDSLCANRDKWRWQLVVLPWLPFENAEFVPDFLRAERIHKCIDKECGYVR
jgi:hypothetical protein